MEKLLDHTVNEEARLNALRDLKLLDSPPSDNFDRLTRLASQLLKAPVSTISLTDRDRQWFKSKVGVDLTEIPREQAPCSYAIEGDGVFVVRDLNEDERFIGSPLAKAGIRFYAGAPLFTRDGHGLGTLCVVDEEARDLREGEGEVLQDLAGLVMSQIDLQNRVGQVDPGTGHPNQLRLREEVESLASHAAGKPAALLSIDVLSPTRADYTVRVMGSESVSMIMQQALSAVTNAAGEGARVFHTGRTRCAVLIEGDLLESYALADRIVAALKEPLSCEGVPITADPSIGVFDFTIGEVSARDVFHRASGAADDARETSSGRARYNPASDQRNGRRFALLNDFGTALQSPDQLSLVYQPRIELASGRHTGVEALLRWNHPQLGAISPGEFVPLVEQTALGRSMTEWVVGQAIGQARSWMLAGKPHAMSINASAMNLDEEDFAERLLAAACGAGVNPADLELEFTESAIARDADRVIDQLRHLRDHGVSIAIDDFGTGYSNLSYLQKLPVSVLKIDQAFVRDMANSTRDSSLVRTMITMGHDLGYRVVAEGIENRDVFDMLGEWGCDEGQGYFMSRPVNADLVFGAHEPRLAAIA
ncbi:sensor domain-containing phosphodiesterase [Erythrobacter sp. LQ02-29]|uniref:bifunctional diguanylate cyclase/phosphodiesterase n=1 Tax=Erythrobacter sp. LQ02-29 TaxID=2920384 RepID=UPI001F4EADAE|nr:sensor domain-containing phosphodiesterase [Erythrobacter sp. LQ02-29]MCP9222792.1 sensor domain-containing phosphodiesterase [Erythrobacter sp. LQ02-29]